MKNTLIIIFFICTPLLAINQTDNIIVKKNKKGIVCFVKYDLSGYDLSDIDLRGVLFSVSTLKRANLENANLEDSIAYATHFEESNLRNAIFRNAVLSKSFFMKSEIEGADFTGAIIDDPQRESMCERASGVNSMTGVDTYESLDCLSLVSRSVR